jgi:hypothetical protein
MRYHSDRNAVPFRLHCGAWVRLALPFFLSLSDICWLGIALFCPAVSRPSKKFLKGETPPSAMRYRLDRNAVPFRPQCGMWIRLVLPSFLTGFYLSYAGWGFALFCPAVSPALQKFMKGEPPLRNAVPFRPHCGTWVHLALPFFLSLPDICWLGICFVLFGCIAGPSKKF